RPHRVADFAVLEITQSIIYIASKPPTVSMENSRVLHMRPSPDGEKAMGICSGCAWAGPDEYIAFVVHPFKSHDCANFRIYTKHKKNVDAKTASSRLQWGQQWHPQICPWCSLSMTIP